jgi:isocitrate/isopropylmalate dehydrogenase
MTSHKILLLLGDGIGPEVMAEVEKIISVLVSEGIAQFEFEKGLVGRLIPSQANLDVVLRLERRACGV